MAKELYRDIELIDGRTVRLYRPPYMRIQENVRKRLPEPQPPVVTETTKAGKDITMTLKNDPDYLAAHEAWDRQFDEEVDKMGSLFMFKDEEVPEDWDVEAEVGAEMRYFDPDWAPREGPIGRKLDYIQWSILEIGDNVGLVTRTLAEMSGIDLREVAANEASFPDQVEEPPA